jgi:hypothetical protein
VTHEVGHFLGLAHSTEPDSIMFWSVASGPSRRQLTDDDILGLCTVYRPGGTRATGGRDSTAADACDPTPTNGFSSQCAVLPGIFASTPGTGCHCDVALGSGHGSANGGSGRSSAVFAFATFATVALGMARRRRG